MSDGFEPGFGATLAAAREAKGFSRNEVAERLKLSPRQIEALEAEDWAKLPSPVYVRGFVRNYARLLEIDPDALIRHSEGAPMPTQTITAPSASVRLGGSPVARWLLLPLFIIVLFVASVAALYSWLRQGEDAMLPLGPDPQQMQVPPLSVAPPATSAHTDAATKPEPLPTTATSTATATANPNLPDPADPARTSIAKPLVVKPTAEPATTQLAVTPAPEPGATEAATPDKVSMRFSTTEDAWIQVVDSKGMRFSKLMRAGASEVVSGTPPFKLVVGNAASVSLVYNGRYIDLKPFIGEKVARLTLE